MDDPRTLTVDQALGLDGLRDPASALTCRCACHHRRFGRPTHIRPDGSSPYDDGGPLEGQEPTHDDGRACPCQQTAEERAAAMDRLCDSLATIRASQQEVQPAHDLDLDRARQAGRTFGLDDITVQTRACPLQITARHDGSELYLRERHGAWRLELAGQVIATGTDDDLAGDHGWIDDHLSGGAHTTGPLTRTVAVIAAALARYRADPADCEHEGARPFCPRCGEHTTGG